ncbi:MULTISPECIES: hypothetical protein [unclassified Prochlorococcus]|uniref:hypothetical protein n=1 Tax=unclassified Prochlorococcus TaxID=2627481 RepID=UPI000533892A|nr:MULTISPECIES: hypothetical protein [unclassified Prochlorococcus]KGG27183.1 hypothetical protein EV12_1322 [Prochlorococcus sp. MIT 0701]
MLALLKLLALSSRHRSPYKIITNPAKCGVFYWLVHYPPKGGRTFSEYIPRLGDVVPG